MARSGVVVTECLLSSPCPSIPGRFRRRPGADESRNRGPRRGRVLSHLPGDARLPALTGGRGESWRAGETGRPWLGAGLSHLYLGCPAAVLRGPCGGCRDPGGVDTLGRDKGWEGEKKKVGRWHTPLGQTIE